MKKLGVIALVVTGLLAILQGTAFLGFAFTPELLGAKMDGIQLFNLASSVLPAVAALGIGFILIGFRVGLANRWFEDGELSTSVDAQSLLQLTFLATGVWALASAIPMLLGSIMTAFAFGAGGYSQAAGVVQPFLDVAPRALPQILQIATGMLLIGYSRPLARRLWQGRATADATPVRSLAVCPSGGEPYVPEDYRDTENALCSRCKEPLAIQSEASSAMDALRGEAETE
jgi:hypothetical protein